MQVLLGDLGVELQVSDLLIRCLCRVICRLEPDPEAGLVGDTGVVGETVCDVGLDGETDLAVGQFVGIVAAGLLISPFLLVVSTPR